MNTFRLAARLFYKNPLLVISYCLLFGYINYEFIRIFSGVSAYNQTAFVFLSETLAFSMLCAAFFVLFSYEFFSKIKSVSLDECIATIKYGKIKILWNQFLFIALLVFGIAATTLIYNFRYPAIDLSNTEYLIHMISSILFYMFIVPLVGVLIGMCVSLLFKRLTAYLILVAFILFSSPLASTIAFTISDATSFKVNISFIFDIFNLYPVNLDYSPIYGFGISLLPYKIEAVFFWAFAAIAVVLIKVSIKSQRTIRITAWICSFACAANFILFCQPSSKVDMSYRVDGTLFSDQMFYHFLYNDGYPKEEPAEFRVLSYDLNVDVRNQLYVTANLKLDRSDLSVYSFTLYHNYKVKKVTDQNSAALDFKQDVDHLEIYTDNPVSEVTLTYSGYNSRFYSNSQGTFLPGYFAYYPIAGKFNVYSPDLQSYAKLLLPNEAEFRLKIRSSKQIFTNIDIEENGEFSGKTNGLTIMSGFLKSTEIEGVEIIYPHFNTNEFRTTQLEQDIKLFLEVKNEDIVKKIFVVPGVNQQSDSIVAYSDYLTAEQLITLPEQYIYTKMLDYKVLLYEYQNLYLNSIEDFNSILAMEAEYPLGYDRICSMYKEKMESLGADFVIRQTNAYLFDGSDRRSIIEFLNQLDNINKETHDN